MGLLQQIPTYDNDSAFPFLREVDFTTFAQRLQDESFLSHRFVGLRENLQKARLILGSSGVNNLWVIGDVGSGKTSLIEALLRARACGQLTSQFMTKPHFIFEVSSYFTHKKNEYSGQFEHCLDYITERNGVLIIDHFDDFLRTADADSEMIVNSLIYALDRDPSFRAIIVSEREAEKAIHESSTGIRRRFKPLKLTFEPNFEVTKLILLAHITRLEKIHQVNFTEKAVDEIIRLLARYPGRAFLGVRPANAIHFADTVATHVRLNMYAEPSELATLEEEISTLQDHYHILCGDGEEAKQEQLQIQLDELRQKYSTLKEEWSQKFSPMLTAMTVAEKVALDHRRLSRIDRDRNEEQAYELLSKQRIPTQEAVKKEERALYPHPPSITPSDVRLVFSQEGGIDIGILGADKLKRLEELPTYLDKRIFLQERAKSAITQIYRDREMGVSNPSRPAGILMFIGGTGLGKTELVHVLTRFDGGENAKPLEILFSEYKGKAATSKFIGADPGLIGHGDRVQIEEVKDDPRKIIIFDEIDKADPEVFDPLLQILDKGKVTLAKNGEVVDFKETIIVLATNALSIEDFSPEEVSDQEKIFKKLLDARNRNTGELLFRKEMLARCTALIIFDNLRTQEAVLILQKEIEEINRDYKPRGISIVLPEDAAKHLVDLHYVKELGGRSLRNIATIHLRPVVSAYLAKRYREFPNQDVQLDDTLRVFVNQQEITLEKIS